MIAASRYRRPALLAAATLAGVVVVIGGMQLIGRGPTASLTPSPSAAASVSFAPSSPALGASPSLAASSLPSEAPPSASVWQFPSPGPNAETGTDLAWQQVATFATAKNVSVSDVAAGPGGYVAVGVLIDGVVTEIGIEGTTSPAIWHSTDGTTWTEGDASAFGGHAPFAITSDGSRYVALLYDGDRTLVYQSVDGRTWGLIASQPITTDVRVWDIAAAPGFGFIALGARNVSYELSLWNSSDGAAWTKQLDVADGLQPNRLAIGPNEALAFGYGPTEPSLAPVLWRSTTGADWQRHDPPAAGRGGLEAAGSTLFGWFAAGFVDQFGIAVWRSADAQQWTALPQQPELRTDYQGDSGSAGTAFAFAGSEYLFGYASCCGFPPQRTYQSADGDHWGRVARTPATFPVHFGTVIVEGDRVIAIGNTLGVGGIGGTGGMWIGRVPT